MSQAILQTKLHLPRPRHDVVARPRLVEQLNAGLSCKLSLICAPAGYGKTTLLSQWASACNRPVAWVSLDEGDNDLACFVAYILAAFDRIGVNIETGLSGMVQPAGMVKAKGQYDVEKKLTLLLNQVDNLPEPLALVLDDYHVIRAQPTHEALTFLLDHLPDNLHIVIATRTDPPLPVARMRGQGQLNELRAADLQFTPLEAADFLQHEMHIDFTEEEVTALVARTEGWIAGLQMAALSSRGRQDLAGFITTITGSQRYILDYLVEEVLLQQPEEVQSFLLLTSILDRLCAPLCKAVIESSEPGLQSSQSAAAQVSRYTVLDSQKFLEHLEHTNLFVVPLDDHREWYRYHHLFAELLQMRLQQTQPGIIPELHHRASSWYEKNGRLAGAIDHAFAAGDAERAAFLVEQAAETTLKLSQLSTLRGWLDALPEAAMRSHPVLYAYHAWIFLLCGLPLEKVENSLQTALDSDPTGSTTGIVMTFQALIAAYKGDYQHCSALARKALALFPEGQYFFRSLITGFLGAACFWNGDLAHAKEILKEAVRVSQISGNQMSGVLAMSHIGEILLLEGQLHQAESFFDQAYKMSFDSQGQPLPVAGLPLIGSGYLLWEWNNLEGAETRLLEGIDLIKRWGEPGTINGYIALSYVRQSQGDLEGAVAAILAAQQIAFRFEAMTEDDVSVACSQASLWVRQGNIEAARCWSMERRLENVIAPDGIEENFSSIPLTRAREYVVFTRLLIAQSRIDDALKVIRPLQQRMEALGCYYYYMHLLCLEALALHTAGQSLQALNPLRRALILAEPEGLVRSFVDEGQAVKGLLEGCRLQVEGSLRAYVNQLLEAFTHGRGPTTQPSPSNFPPDTIHDPLSARELDVLRLLTSDLSSSEIAAVMVVSVHTVRTHLKNIYSKLGVHTRYEAVSHAKDLGLL